MRILIAVLGLLSVVSGLDYSLPYYRSSRPNYFPSSSSYRSSLAYTGASNYLDETKLKFNKICPGKEAEFDEAIEQAEECIGKIDTSSETMCSMTSKYFAKCTQPMVDLLKGCFEKDAKYVPGLIVEMMLAANKFICKSDGEHLFELFNGCIMKSNYRTRTCIRRIQTKMQQYQKKMPTKEELCEAIQSLKPCVSNHLQNSCGHIITRESVMELYDAVASPCKSVDAYGLNLNEIEVVE